MLTVYDSQNQPRILGERLGSGGEGTVYVCDDSASLVAKIYREPITREKAEKLRWMAAHKNEQLLKVAAWVVDVLQDQPNGKIVGFLMPKIKAKEIHELYALKSRRIYFPEATWFFLIHTAANVARAFYNLHKNGHIMGDVNHGNCVVSADGTVKLIDCDSYSIKTEKQRYFCEVGVGTHLAPELHGVKLDKTEREFKHDNFGLAVIIFQLLFLGRHPFAGNYLGVEDKSIEDCIREHRFAYGTNAKLRNVQQPPGTLQLEAVSPRVALMLERAFLTEDRPEPREWIEALEDLSDNLEQCTEHPGHVFYKNLAVCPWCELEAQTGVMLFPFVMSGINTNHKGKNFDVQTIENLLAGFEAKEGLQNKLADYIPRTSRYKLPSPEIVKENVEQRNQKLTIIILFSIIYSCACFVDFTCAFLLGVIATVVIHTNFGSLGKMIRADAEDRLTKARQKWQSIEDDWTQLLAVSAVQKNVVEIKEKIADYTTLKEADSEVIETGESSAIVRQAEKKEKLEKEISSLLNALRSGSLRMSKYVRQIQAQSKPLINELAQAESNVKYLGTNLPLTVIIGAITIGIPIIGATFFHKSKPASDFIVSNTKTASNSATNTAAAINTAPKMNVFVPEENITNREIGNYSMAERRDIAAELVKRAILDLSNNQLDSAEKKLNFAQRFDDKNWELLNAFGSVYYERENYKKSIDYLKRSLAIADSDDANFYLGIDYIRMEQYQAARDVFIKLTTRGMQNNAVFYNLGLAQQELKDYTAAIRAYQKSLSFAPGDLDATYRMGICYAKLKDADQVRLFYLAIQEKDKARAAQFKAEVGKSFDLDSPPDAVR